MGLHNYPIIASLLGGMGYSRDIPSHAKVPRIYHPVGRYQWNPIPPTNGMGPETHILYHTMIWQETQYPILFHIFSGRRFNIEIKEEEVSLIDLVTNDKNLIINKEYFITVKWLSKNKRLIRSFGITYSFQFW